MSIMRLVQVRSLSALAFAGVAMLFAPDASANSMADTVRGAGYTLVSAFENVESSYPGVMALFTAFCYLAGTWMLISGLYKLRAIGGPGQQASTAPVVSLIIGLLLVNAPSTLHTMAYTLWDSQSCGSYPGFMDYVQTVEMCGSGDLGLLVHIFRFVQVYGVFAFIRGLMLMNRAGKVGSGSDSEGIFVKGFTHTAMGVGCIYIVDTLRLLGNTFGVAFLDFMK